MKKHSGILLLLASFIFLLSSCNSGSDEAALIPENAPFVAVVNTQSINGKISIEEIKNTSWFKELQSDSSTPDWGKKVMEAPEESGVDLSKNLYFFMNDFSGTNQYISVLGSIKSQSDFENFNKNFGSGAPIKGKNDVNIMILKNQNVVGWKNNKFIYVLNASAATSEISKWDPTKRLEDLADTPTTPQFPAALSDIMSDYCASLFNLKKDSSLAKNNFFSKMLKEKGDIHLWQNTEAMMKSNPGLGMLSMLKLDVLFEKSYSASTAIFEDGKIVLKQKQHVGPEMLKFVKKYNGSALNTEMIERIPSQNILGVLAGNFKPDAIEEFIKLIGADGLANMFLQQAGISLHDFSLANNGDFLLALTDLNPNAKTSNSDSNALSGDNPEAKILFSMGVKSKPAFQKIIDVLEKNIPPAEMGGTDTPPYSLDDKFFVAGTNSDLNNAFLAGSSKNKFDFVDEIKGHPFAGFIDIQKILTAIATDNSSSANDKEMLAENQKMWKKIVFSAGDIEGESVTGNGTIQLMDEKTNSLKQLNSFLDKMYSMSKAKKAETTGSTSSADSLLVPPAIDTVISH